MAVARSVTCPTCHGEAFDVGLPLLFCAGCDLRALRHEYES